MRKTGRVKWFDHKKGFGFITPVEGGADVFVHVTAVQEAGLDTLSEGQMIEYELKDNRGKKAASYLKKIA